MRPRGLLLGAIPVTILELIAETSEVDTSPIEATPTTRIIAEYKAEFLAVFAKNNQQQRLALATELEEQARWAKVSIRLHGQDWADLAAQLQALAVHLREE